MSHSSSPNNRNSIFGWVKNLKSKNLLSNDSINEISDADILSSSDNPRSDIESHSYHQEFLRPILNHKSRSTNNVNRVRSNSQSDNFRQHRDSFLLNNPLVDKDSKYFGVSLEEAVDQGCAKISIFTDDDSNLVLLYGRIPIVVAKCGIYLKDNGLNVEGIFRVSGSSKRVKDLQVVFNSPPDFGKKLNWDGYTVHDAASILRRYLNSLPEPLIPLELYDQFREPLRSKSRIINYMKYKASHPVKVNKEEKSDTTALDSTAGVETEASTSANGTVTDSPTKDSTPAPPSESVLDPVKDTPKTVNTNNSLPSPSITQDSIELEEDEEHEHEEDDDDDNNKNNSNNNNKNNNNNDKTKDLMKLKQAKKSKNYKKLTKDVHEAIDEYKQMLDKLPILSKQLLFYILDLLAMVQNHSEENLMPSRNLAAIFQPSILSHPSHDLNPTEYYLSQLVVEFLIQYAYKLLPNHDNLIKSNSSVNLKPKAGYQRQHSKSLSSSNNHEDLVGYQNRVSSTNLPVIDKDYDATDDETDESIKDSPEIIVSTPN